MKCMGVAGRAFPDGEVSRRNPVISVDLSIKQRMRRVRYRFTLRSYIIASAIVGIAVAIWTMHAENQRHVVVSVLQLHGRVIYAETTLPIPSGLVRLLGYDYFCSVECVMLYPTEESIADDQIRSITGLRGLRSIAIWPRTQSVNANMADHEITNYLTVGYETPAYAINEQDVAGGVSEAGLKAILTAYPNLEHLSLIGARVPLDSPTYSEAHAKIPSIEMLPHSAYNSREMVPR